MANINKRITLTEKNDSGPFYDFYYSVNNGLSYTSSVESPIYLQNVGSSEIVTVDSTSNAYKLTSRGACLNSVVSSSIQPTPVPTSTSVPTPTPTFDPSITPTPSPTATVAPTPTPTQACTTYSSHTITKSGANQHKSIWAGSSQVYNAQALVSYLSGQVSPTQNNPYNLLDNVRIYNSSGIVYGALSNNNSTVSWFFDGVNVTVEVNNVVISGTYSDGGSYTDVWCYGLGHEVPPTPTATPTGTPTPTPTPTPNVFNGIEIRFNNGTGNGTTINYYPYGSTTPVTGEFLASETEIRHCVVSGSKGDTLNLSAGITYDSNIADTYYIGTCSGSF